MGVNFGYSATFILEICVSHGEKVYAVWRLPYKTHRYLLPLLSDCLAFEDEICRQSLNFKCDCFM